MYGVSNEENSEVKGLHQCSAEKVTVILYFRCSPLSNLISLFRDNMLFDLFSGSQKDKPDKL